MKITRFEAENFKRLKAVEIEPDGTTVVIAGRNAQGKTSVLDGIMAALAGRAGAKELVRPIRDGESKARVVVELDDLTVERKWTASGSTVTVSPKGGNAKLNSPQAVLDKLIGALSFDPLAFAEADDKDQVKTLIDLIGREEFDRIAEERKAAYDERTVVNREVKSIKSRLDALPAVTQHGARIDIADLTNELMNAERRERYREDWERLEARIADLRAEQEEIVEKVNALPTTQPVTVLRNLLNEAADINKVCDIDDQREALSDEYGDAQGRAHDLTTRIEKLDAEKAELIAKAPLPVDGLSFDEDGVILNGVPFIQSSAAERLKVSVGLAMALNPELRVICIRDASLLDSDSRAALVAMAEEHDYQIWYEVVGDAGEIGVVIEDGMVQS